MGTAATLVEGRPLHGRRRFLFLVVSLLLALVASTAHASDLERARQQRAQVQQRLDQAAVTLDEIQQQIARAEAEKAELQRQLDELQGQLDQASERVAERVRSLYKHGAVDPVTALLGTGDPAGAIERATMVARLVRGDQVASEVATSARTQLSATVEAVEAADAELEAAVARQREVIAQLSEDLEQAKALEDRLEADARRRAEEEARRRAAAAASRAAEARAAEQTRNAAVQASGGYACPVGQPRSFTDTWGAPRSGGRRHKGTDILAPYGIPVYAIVSGTVDIRTPGPSAGRWIMLRGVDGTTYYYMHLQSYTVADGARVSAGAQIATNGDTGNARGTPHVHFEQHPGGGSAINPYPLLKRICG